MIVLDNLWEFAHHLSHFSLSSNFADKLTLIDASKLVLRSRG
ncbi:MAG TPA: hypothetical protein VMD25_05655 [Acidobacteriaceae bacterium]|nr:hypothetical protein [Acidobacteriaceae bacterium]